MKKVEIGALDRVINTTIDAVENGQREIFGLYEHAKTECERLEAELKNTTQLVKETIERVDDLEKREKSARTRLFIVSRDIETYGEEDMKDAYEHSRDLQIKLYLEREREIHLKEKRNDLEHNYRAMTKILNQCENVSVQMGVAISFLRGDIGDASLHLTDVDQKHFLAGRIITSLEEERRRMARDIHDGAAQTMANAIIQAEICERLMDSEPQEAMAEIRGLKELVRNSLGELRTIIFNLRPPALDDLGLYAVVRSYCSDFQEETGIFTDFKVLGDIHRADPNTEVTLFRIIQEALTNIKKHARANSVLIKYEAIEDCMTMVITDDGIGFAYDDTIKLLKERGHFGLLNIRERVELLNGKLSIETSPGKGTKIWISFPLKQN